MEWGWGIPGACAGGMDVGVGRNSAALGFSFLGADAGAGAGASVAGLTGSVATVGWSPLELNFAVVASSVTACAFAAGRAGGAAGATAVGAAAGSAEVPAGAVGAAPPAGFLAPPDMRWPPLTLAGSIFSLNSRNASVVAPRATADAAGTASLAATGASAPRRNGGAYAPPLPPALPAALPGFVPSV